MLYQESEGLVCFQVLPTLPSGTHPSPWQTWKDMALHQAGKRAPTQPCPWRWLKDGLSNWKPFVITRGLALPDGEMGSG